MRTTMGNRGIKRQRVTIIPSSDLFLQELGPRRKRVCVGGGLRVGTGKFASIEEAFHVTDFDKLNDDVLISVLSKVSASATAPSDLIKINFHCFGNYSRGITLLERAAKGSHAEALYSLAIIQFNGCDGAEDELSYQKNPNSAANLCIKSAKLGNIDALRELGYCFQSGYGLPPSPAAAYRLLKKAKILDLTASTSSTNILSSPRRRSRDFSLLTNYGYMGREVHMANAFMVEWWWLGDQGEDGLHMCSNVLCGRRETRKDGFRRCSHCQITMYCSHACQEVHWIMEHRATCLQVPNV